MSWFKRKQPPAVAEGLAALQELNAHLAAIELSVADISKKVDEIYDFYNPNKPV